MLYRAYVSHFRAVRQGITTAAAIGTAIALGYLILWVRL
jgi:hypothetical protein